MVFRIAIICALQFLGGFCFSQDYSEKFGGKWKVSTNEKHLSKGAMYMNYGKSNSLKSDQFERLEASMASREYVFSNDGNFSVDWNYANGSYHDEGKWNIDGTSKLHLVTEDTHLIYTIEFIESNVLLMVPEGQEKGQVKRFVLLKQ